MYRCFLATTILVHGIFHLILPALANGAKAGDTLENTATGTYEDPNDPGKTINTTSNTVKVIIAEVAGITITKNTVTDVNLGDIEPGDELYYDFKVKNTGNDPSKFQLPAANRVRVTDENGNASTNGIVSKLQYKLKGATVFTDVPAGGGETPSVDAGDEFDVRVIVTVVPTAAADSILRIYLGNTPDSPNNQNQPRTNNDDDVYTVDNPGTTPTGEIAGDPANGTREASDFLEATVKAQTKVFNGPKDAPEAVGLTTDTANPAYQNDDFTNKSSPVAANTEPGKLINPDPVTFTNSVQHSGSSPKDISILPTPPTIPGDLPTGTKVTIKFGSEEREYLWNGTKFTKTDGTDITAKTDYITIPGVTGGAGGKRDYTVTVDLPANTALSTDTEKGYPVPITTFIDDATPGLGTTEPRNTTIDRVYTGFMKMEKLSKLEKGTGPDVPTGQDTFSKDDKTPAAGNIIVYQIVYKNISEAAPTGGNGNVTLSAKSFKIIEDGTAGTNNWAKDNNSDGKIDTSNEVGSAIGSATGTTAFFNGEPPTSGTDQSGDTAATDVTKYEYSVTNNVAPQETGTFEFKRKVSPDSPLPLVP